jgi:hypothetical protein
MYHSCVRSSARIDGILYTAFLQYGVYNSFNIDSDSLILVVTPRLSNYEFLEESQFLLEHCIC